MEKVGVSFGSKCILVCYCAANPGCKFTGQLLQDHDTQGTKTWEMDSLSESNLLQ